MDELHYSIFILYISCRKTVSPANSPSPRSTSANTARCLSTIPFLIYSCSLECYKEHQRQHLQQIQLPEEEEKIEHTEETPVFRGDIRREIEEEHLVPASRLKKLECPSLRKSIVKYKEFICKINRSRSRVKQVSTYQQNDPAFLEFSYQLLRQMGYLDCNNRFGVTSD